MLSLGPGCSPWLWDAPLGSRMPSSILEFQVGAEGLPDPGATPFSNSQLVGTLQGNISTASSADLELG